MTNLVCKAVNAKITTDPKRMSVSGWLSAPTVDTDGEVIDGAAFDLNVHKSNPICLWMHRQNESPIGRWSDNDGNYTLRTKAFPGGGNGLFGTVFFASTKRGEEMYTLYDDKVLTSFSAGFKPGRTTIEKSAGRNVRRFLSAELHEGSCVNFASNRDALATMVHKHAKLPTWLAADLASSLPKTKTFAVTKNFKVIPTIVKPGELESKPTIPTGSRKMAENIEAAIGSTAELVTKAAEAVDPFGLMETLFADPKTGAEAWGKVQALAQKHNVCPVETVTKANEGTDTLVLKSLTDNWNAAAPVLNDLQARIEALETNAITRAEYDADLPKIQGAIEAVSSGKKVAFKAA